MATVKTSAIKIHAETKAKLDKLKRPGQSTDGVIQELIQWYEKTRPQER